MSDEQKMVDTKGIEPWRVLKALYDGGRPIGAGHLRFRPGGMEDAEAQRLVAGGDSGDYPGGRQNPLYFDYVYGRPLKVSLKNPDGFDPWGYDRDNGEGAAQRAIDSLRAVSA